MFEKIKKLAAGLVVTTLVASTLVFTSIATVSAQGCGLREVGPWSEVFDSQDVYLPQRIEVGGGSWQHADWYPGPGVRTISYVVAPQEPDLWWGSGQMWTGDCPNGTFSDEFDYIADAAGYAHGSDWQPGRLNNGHSGIVMDTSTCSIYDTLWDTFTTEATQTARVTYVNGLLAKHRAGQDPAPCASMSADSIQGYDVDTYSAYAVEINVVLADVEPATVDEPTNDEDLAAQINELQQEIARLQAEAETEAPNNDATQAIQPDPETDTTAVQPRTNKTYGRCPKADVERDPGNIRVNGPAIIHPWWNNGKPAFGQTQRRLMLESGESIKMLDMMGLVYLYKNTDACSLRLPDEYENGSSLDEISISKLIKQGLAKRVN